MSGCELCDTIAAEAAKPSSKPKLTKVGKVLLGITGASFATVCAVTVPFMLPALRKVCLPYVPATTAQVENVMKLLAGHKGKLIDLGSGDGRIVIEAARRGFSAEGIELNPWLVWYSRFSARRHGLHTKAKFYTKDLWKHNLSQYDHIVIFGVDSMMPQLEGKLVQELGPNSQVVACRFPFNKWQPNQTVDQGIDTVWLYKQPLQFVNATDINCK